MAEDAADPATQRLAGMVQDNTRRINRLVEEVLQLNRRDRVRSETLELSRFLPELIDSFVLAHPDTAGRILTRYLAPVSVRFDRGHLQQILGNLLSNGWRYSSGTPGAVRMEIDHDCIRVIDDGPGIAPIRRAICSNPFSPLKAAVPDWACTSPASWPRPTVPGWTTSRPVAAFA